MDILIFLLNLAGATMLLLFAVRMVRTGIERAFGARFQRVLTAKRSLAGAATAGVGLALVLQSSAAVALLVAGFSATGILAFPTGLAMVLGGDLGSSLVIQVLSFRLDWLVPLALAVGGGLFIKAEDRRLRQYGRIIMGIALILISLRFLREAMEPIRDSAFLPAIADYLAYDFMTAFLVGAVLAFVMHSSVATILMCVTLVNIGAIPLAAGMSLVLGANLGSAIIPIWLSRGMPSVARRVPMVNMALRGSWALIMLLAVNLLPLAGYLSFGGPAQTLINTHILFNLSLLLLALPFIRQIGAQTERAIPTSPQTADSLSGAVTSALDRTMISTPRLALASLKREVLRMSEIVERMARPVMEVYTSGNLKQIEDLIALDDQVNATLSDIRRYAADLPADGMSKDQTRAVQDLVNYAISLEMAGDIVAERLLARARQKAKRRLQFSDEGQAELQAMHECVLANIRLASNVLFSDDLESARLLVEEKAEIARVERQSRMYHIKRLSEGKVESFETSDMHLETLRGLKDLNSQCSAIAYPLLYRSGQLLETRLIKTLSADHIDD